LGGVNRRILTLLVALVPIVAFGIVVSVVTVPFVSLGPGPTFNTLGEVEGKEVVTIEGLDPAGNHPVQVAWRELSVPQCGFCQAGQIMQASALLAATPNPTDQEILDGMRDNICRCGCYQRIVAAVRVAATGI
jgi:xanthine dehydrogenase iron-sulfur cluster and FAD-binding subunit A